MATIEIISGEGTENGTVEEYTGDRTMPAIMLHLARARRPGGDRWAFARIDGERVEDLDIPRALWGYRPYCARFAF